MTIILGVLCLGFIIFIHELGHFFAARLCGVKVESFSIGMGPVLLHKTMGGTDYRLSLLPFGGYCGMKGEQAFREALEQNLDSIPAEPGGFYGVHPLKRALIAVAGPAMNLFFAVIAFTIIAMTGYTYYSADNRVIMADEILAGTASAAHNAGLMTGDRIISVDGEPVKIFSDISEKAGTNPGKTLRITVLRDGKQLDFDVIATMDRETGLGKIGVMNWVDPLVAGVDSNSTAEKAGFLPGDLIIAIDDDKVSNTADIQKFLLNKDSATIRVERIRNGSKEEKELVINIGKNIPLGLQFSVPEHQAERHSFFPAIGQGIRETGELVALTFKSIGLLFKGVDLSNAVSGPIRITVMLGDSVQSGFYVGFKAGLVNTLNFLALISVSLFIMNLLPIPVLDGGLVLFALIEAIARRPVHPKIMYYSQFIGIAFILILLGIAIFSDANYVIKGIQGK